MKDKDLKNVYLYKFIWEAGTTLPTLKVRECEIISDKGYCFKVENGEHIIRLLKDCIDSDMFDYTDNKGGVSCFYWASEKTPENLAKFKDFLYTKFNSRIETLTNTLNKYLSLKTVLHEYISGE